jgi:acetyl-CoA acetyltransferase
MPEAYIYDHVRTPRGRGKKDGALHEVPAVRLAATALEAIRDRNGIDTKKVDDVVLGCVDPVGEAGGDIARAAVFAADYDTSVPGMQINRFCASGLDAVNMASAQVMSGQHKLVIAGGVESMSRVGLGASGGAWPIEPQVAIPSYFMPQGVSADLIATKYGFSRDDVDAYAVESQKRAAKSWEDGRSPSPSFRSRTSTASPSSTGRAHASGNRHAVARLAQSVLRNDGPWAVSMRLAFQAHPEVENDQPRSPRRQLLRASLTARRPC